MDKNDEQIIVVPRKALFGDERLAFQGTEDSEEKVGKIIKNMSKNFGVMRRGNAEESEKFKQPIPYAVIRKDGKLFMYERLKGGGEEKLHNKLSLGVGGHMNLFEAKGFDNLLMENLHRELDEELKITNEGFDLKIDIVGLINDDSNSVGRVHIGILSVTDLPNEVSVEVRETDKLKGEWIALEELKKDETYNRLENWSKIVVDTLVQ